MNKENKVEAALIKAIRKGDRQVFSQLVLEHQGRVYYTALRLLGEHEDALDVSQDVFLKVWKHINSLKKDLKLYAWIYRITVNCCLDRLRKRTRNREIPLTEQDVITIPDRSVGTHPRDVLHDKFWREKVELALEHLPKKQKIVFVLKHFQHLKLREIADILDSPIGTVKATLHHAIRRLRSELPPLEQMKDAKKKVGKNAN